MFQKLPHESVTLILRSLLNFPTGEDLVHPSTHPSNKQTFIKHPLCTRDLEIHQGSRQTQSLSPQGTYIPA